ncbi:MAG: hypothetical protein QM751_12890 [Paludibacteraceae bacterium]
MASFLDGQTYWTSTESTDENAIQFTVDSSVIANIYADDKNSGNIQFFLCAKK